LHIIIKKYELVLEGEKWKKKRKILIIANPFSNKRNA
jgi:hypothetical protein